MTQDLAGLAQDAYIWGIPLVQTRMYLALARELDLPYNQLFGSPALSTPDSEVPLPNVDTLYGLGWMDLRDEPQIVFVPDTDDRYYLIQLNDAYLNSFCYIGRRATGTKAARFAIVAPGWQGELPDDVQRIDAPTAQILALTRVLVDDEADLPAARAVQDNFALTPLSHYPDILSPNRPINDAFNNFPILQPASLGAQYFDELCQGLVDNPAPDKDRAFVDSLQALGIAPGAKPSAQDAARVRLLTEATEAGHTAIHSRGGWLIDTRHVNDWMVSYGMTQFIEDPLDRAVVAKLGPGCLIPQEGLYFSLLQGPDGEPLTGGKNYQLTFEAGNLPPVDAFWSLTMYGHDRALVHNPIDRYAIGDRTKGLQYGDDGSLTLRIQHARPAAGASNWLPAPAPDAGPFHLFLRTYQPQPRLASGQYQMPALAFS
jgi:hypothetical protein